LESVDSQYGIYFNLKKSEVVRITSPYWLPKGPDWIFLSNDVNLTLSSLKGIIKNGDLKSGSGSVQWGRIPDKD
tara:strand:- start:176 stop:397 length:222 start_codon:yes stop_codon:yes gene_type:complete